MISLILYCSHSIFLSGITCFSEQSHINEEVKSYNVELEYIFLTRKDDKV